MDGLDGYVCPNCGEHLREVQTLTGWALIDCAIHEVLFWVLMIPFALLGLWGLAWPHSHPRASRDCGPPYLVQLEQGLARLPAVWKTLDRPAARLRSAERRSGGIPAPSHRRHRRGTACRAPTPTTRLTAKGAGGCRTRRAEFIRPTPSHPDAVAGGLKPALPHHGTGD